MHSIKVKPKYNSIVNPRVGIIVLATDFRIEKDFITVIKNMDVDLFVNRIHCYFPLTSENLIKMSSTVTDVSKDILPNEKLDCVVYGCTSGTIAAGYETIKKKINLAKPEAKVTTPSSAAIKRAEFDPTPAPKEHSCCCCNCGNPKHSKSERPARNCVCLK